MTDFDEAEMETQFQEVDPKVLQIQMLQELMAIRQLLQSQAQGESETETYTCKACGESVDKMNRIQHSKKHNAPPVDDPEELHLYE